MMEEDAESEEENNRRTSDESSISKDLETWKQKTFEMD